MRKMRIIAPGEAVLPAHSTKQSGEQGCLMALNRLSEETSPYLQQHKHNPVHWWPWRQEAFEEAQRLDKPVLLSVGYAACHWCHVMAHESFEKEDTAALMNDLFVNIKVDREERPDVDTLYMTALQELGEPGRLAADHVPDARWHAIFRRHVFPDKPRYGRPSFKEVLVNVARVYAQEKETIAQNTAYLKSRLMPRLNYGAAPDFSEEQLAAIASKFIGAIDPTNGGLRGAPKFPNVSIFNFLWRAGPALRAEDLPRRGEEHAPAYLPGRHLRSYRRRLLALRGG